MFQVCSGSPRSVDVAVWFGASSKSASDTVGTHTMVAVLGFIGWMRKQILTAQPMENIVSRLVWVSEIKMKKTVSDNPGNARVVTISCWPTSFSGGVSQETDFETLVPSSVHFCNSRSCTSFLLGLVKTISVWISFYFCADTLSRSFCL